MGKLYVTKNRDGVVRLHQIKPLREDDLHRTELHGVPRPIKMCRDWQTYGSVVIPADSINFEISWNDEPKEVKITLV